MKLKYPIPRLRSVEYLTELALEGADCKGWYEWARLEVELAAPMLGVTPKRLADLLALFSPRTTVMRSVRWTIHYIKNDRAFMHDVMQRTHKSAIIHYERTGIIRGVKTLPFAKALMGDQNAMVLDSWMYKAVGVDPKRGEVKAVHRAVSARIRSVAKYIGWTIVETQAAIWAGMVRRERVNVPAISIVSEIDGDETWS